MNCRELIRVKAEMLCHGVKASNETMARMEEVNSYVLDKGFMHAAHFILGNLIVNTCISEEFCKKSPYEIRATKSAFSLYKDNHYISRIKVLPLPNWCKEEVDGYTIGDFLRPHSSECIACWPALMCNFYANGSQCKFCSMGDYRIRTILNEKTVSKMIKTALDVNPNYEVALSGGTCDGPDHSISYFSHICKDIRSYGAKYVSVEIAPPDDLDYISRLKESGATAIIMNLEVADDAKRIAICPGKAKIPMEHYFSAYERAVSEFGSGNVSCVLIAGLQPAADIIRKSAELIDLGVVPTIIPFKPLDGCLMKSHKTADPDELIMISGEVEKLLVEKGITAGAQYGCTKCNGCSLETAFAQTESV